MEQQHGFASALLGDNSPIGNSGGNGGGAFAAVGSAAGGTAGQFNFGNGFSLFGGASIAAEDYTQLSVRNVITLAAAVRYTYTVAPKTHVFAEVGGWYSPNGSYKFTRTYANGAGTATGIGSTSGRQNYVFARVGAAYDVTAQDEAALSGELGHQEFNIHAYNEQFSATNPFEAHIPGTTDRTNTAKLRVQWTHSFTTAIDITGWAAAAHNFGYETNLVAFVPGFGLISPRVANSTRAEFGARVGYHVTDNIAVDIFANGVSGGRGGQTRIHVGGGVKARF